MIDIAPMAQMIPERYLFYIHLYSPERQQQQVKEAPNTQQQKQTNKREKKLRSNRAD